MPDTAQKTASPLSPPTISFAALAVMLAALAMLGPFSVDTYLPAFPNIERSLQASTLEVQQTLTAYMFAFAVMVLWHGPLSDAFGRRNIILISLGIFAIASIGCAVASDVKFLWFCRILQGLSSGAGTVIGRAIVRDTYDGARATRLMSLTTMIFSIAPAIAPMIGGWIISVSDWRTIFYFLVVYCVFLWVFCYRYLPETLPPEQRIALHPSQIVGSLAEVFRNKLFYLKAGTIALNFSGFFLFVASAPVFVVKHLQLGQDQFGWLFVPAVSGMFLGSLVANRLAGKLPISQQVQIGFVLMIGAALFNCGFHYWNPPALPWSVLPLLLYTTGSSIVAPGVTLLVLDLFPHIRGTAASCQSFMLTMLAAIMAGVVSPLISHSVFLLALGQLSLVSLSLILWSMARHRRS